MRTKPLRGHSMTQSVRVRLGVGCTGRGEARGSRELCACAGHQMLCYVIVYVYIERVLGRGAAGRGGV